MHTTDADLTPAERLREIAAILAAGILRQRTRPESLSACGSSAQAGSPESAAYSPKSGSKEISESGEK